MYFSILENRLFTLAELQLHLKGDSYTNNTLLGKKLTSFWKSWKPRLLSNDTLTSAFPCNRATLAMITSVIPVTTCEDEK